jgi:hypothetical protein
MKNFKYIWHWKERPPGRKGQKCRLMACGEKSSALVEFEDGYICMTDRRGLRKLKPKGA